MRLKNPLAAPDLDMQDIRGGQYALMNPICKILRAEGFGYLALSVALYQALGLSWTQFGIWFFLPDIAILAYVFANERIGMWAYNLTHSSLGAVVVGLVGVLAMRPLYWQISLIWLAHIGLDRALGYRLKFSLGFRATHLGVLKGMAPKT